MNHPYRVLVIEDDKETINRVVNLILPDHVDLAGDRWKIETHTLYVEVVEKKNIKGEFEISDRCVESLINICDKKFDLIIADFGYSNNSSIYDELPLDSAGEIPPSQLKGKVFTPEDLISKVAQYAQNCRGKKRSRLTQNFLRFDGKLVVYSYQDKRFNKVYHTIGERGRITQNVFPRASFDKIYDIKAELFDTNEEHKTDNHFFAFLKCKFINNIIQLKLRDHIFAVSVKSISQSKERLQVASDLEQTLSSTIKTLSKRDFLRSRDFLKLLVFCLFFIIPIIVVPSLAITNRIRLPFDVELVNGTMPILLIVAMGYLTILLGTTFYMPLLYLEIRKSSVEVKSLDFYYIAALVALIFSYVFIGFGLYNSFIRQVEIHDKVKSAERFSILIFVCLLVIDIASYLAKRAQINHNRTQNKISENLEHTSVKKFIVNQIFLIEVPVIAGILLTSRFAESIPVTLFEEARYKNVFFNHFTAGAIAMHIVYSQFVFVLLNANKILNDFREKSHPQLIPIWVHVTIVSIIIFLAYIFRAKLF